MSALSARLRALQPRLPIAAPILVFAIAAGVLVRLAYPEDIHYLGDEAWTFRHVQDARNGEPWAMLGMPSSRGLRNAGLSVWVFIVLGIVGQVTTPAGLTRAVAVLALVAHVLVLAIPLWAMRPKEEQDRGAWTWAVVLTLTNPILVFLERKIWAQSVLPIFMVALLVGWFRRETKGGAFAWGITGALIGQIHMAGFFFAPALALFTRLFGKPREGRTQWIAWIVGSALGALPAIPWFLYLARDRPPAAPSAWWLRFRLEFYQYFFSDPSGLCGEYVFGKDILATLKHPFVFGCPTYLVGAAHVVLAIASLAIAKRLLVTLWEHVRTSRAAVTGSGLRRFVSFVRALVGESETSVLLAATLVGMGALMTLPSISIHRHYMLATFPLQYVLVARVALAKPKGERWLAALFGASLVVCIGFLSYVHSTGENAEMGKTYATQLREGIKPEDAKAVPP